MMMVALTAGCAKEPLAPEQPRPEPVPATEKMELNKSVKFGSSTFRLDIDKDGYNDLLFGYMLVGDASLKVDRYQLITVSPLTVAMPINASEEVALLEKSQPIPMQQNTGFEWYNASSTVLFDNRHYLCEARVRPVAVFVVDRVDHGSATHALKAGFDDLRFGRIKHQWKRRSCCQAANQLACILDTIAANVVDANIEQVGTLSGLRLGDLEAFLPILGKHRLSKRLRAVCVGALTD